MTVTRIGHSCHIIEIGSARILTDPWFTTAPTYFQGEPVVATPTSLGRIDVVVISHEHYDHCDLTGLVDAGFDLAVPLVGPGTVTSMAAPLGFTDLRTVEAWETTTVAEVSITATPALHGVHEITFVLQHGSRAVFFGGDSLRVPELDTIPDRFGHIDLALMPTNGLCIRPMGLEQVVMDAREAAELTAVLKPTLAVPHHYAFHSGFLGDRMITRGDNDPRHFAAALTETAPEIAVRLVLPGTPVQVA